MKHQGEIILPSGRRVVLQEVLADATDGRATVRFRYVAPWLGAGGQASDPAALTPDIEELCAAQVLPYLAETGQRAETVVISLAGRPTEFGVAAPDVLQVFEAFTLRDGLCIWEPF